MIKVLFCLPNFELGGIPRSLLCLLESLPSPSLCINVFCLNHRGPYKTKFKRYKLIPEDWFLSRLSCVYSHLPMSMYKIESFLIKILNRLSEWLGCSLYKKRLYDYSQKFSNKYDYVVAYCTGTCTELVSKIVAPKRIVWMHLDYKRAMIYMRDDEFRSYELFDIIVSPSHFSAQSFIGVFPNLSDRVIVIPNIVDANNIRKLSNNFFTLDSRFDNSSFTIVSVGRICGEKQFYTIPQIVSKVPSKLKWYIIGGGSKEEENALTESIIANNVSDRVILLGPMTNPYPYMSSSNLLVSLSISETFSYVIYESKILHVPVLSAPFGSSDDVMSDGAGVVVERENIPNVIHQLIIDKDGLYTSLKIEAEKYEYVPDTRLFEELFYM